MVDEKFYGLGHGSNLLITIEQIAMDTQCDFIKVDTISFQALTFYENHHYEIYGTLDRVGRGFKHYY